MAEPRENPRSMQQGERNPSTASDGLDDLIWQDPQAKEEARKAGLRRQDLERVKPSHDRGFTQEDIRKLQQTRQTGGREGGNR